MGCDGPPYVMASRLIEADKNEFDWITLLPGLGHLNMSQVCKQFFLISERRFITASKRKCIFSKNIYYKYHTS